MCGRLHGAVFLLERLVEDPAGPVGVRLEGAGCSGGAVLHFVGVAQQRVAEALA